MRMIDADSLKERMLAETPEHEKGVVDLFLEAVVAMIDEQPTIEERKTGPTAEREWLHEYLQTAVDFGIITETQASRLMDMIDDSDDNT